MVPTLLGVLKSLLIPERNKKKKCICSHEIERRVPLWMHETWIFFFSSSRHGKTVFPPYGWLLSTTSSSFSTSHWRTFEVFVPTTSRTYSSGNNGHTFFFPRGSKKFVIYRGQRWSKNNLKGRPSNVCRLKRLLQLKGFFTPAQDLLCYWLLKKGDGNDSFNCDSVTRLRSDSSSFDSQLFRSLCSSIVYIFPSDTLLIFFSR